MEGNVTLAGDQYKLSFLEAIQLFDGTKIYTIVPENEEITISHPEEEEDLSVNPSKLLTSMKKAMVMNGIFNNVLWVVTYSSLNYSLQRQQKK